MYVQSDTLLLADVLGTFEICVLIFLPLSGLALQAFIKKTKVKLDTDILLMVEKYIRGGICHFMYRYTKANKKYMKDYNENKESSYLQYLGVNNLYGCAMMQKLPRKILSGSKLILNCNMILLKTIMKKVIKDTFSKLMFNIPKNYKNFLMI